MLRLKFCSGFPQLRKMQADINRQKFLCYKETNILTPAVMIGSFRKSTVAHRLTNRNGPVKYFFTFALEFTQFYPIELGSLRHIIKC